MTDDKSYEEIKEELQAKSDFLLELDNMPPQTHSWTDRGEKFTCENAGHPWHEAWKAKKNVI
jgi:hypothetical protein